MAASPCRRAFDCEEESSIGGLEYPRPAGRLYCLGHCHCKLVRHYVRFRVIGYNPRTLHESHLQDLSSVTPDRC